MRYVVQSVLALAGLVFLITGKVSGGKYWKWELRGWPARLAGMILLLPVPASFMMGFFIGSWRAARGEDVMSDSLDWLLTPIEALSVPASIAAALIIFEVYRIPVEESQARSTQA